MMLPIGSFIKIVIANHPVDDLNKSRTVAVGGGSILFIYFIFFFLKFIRAAFAAPLIGVCPEWDEIFFSWDKEDEIVSKVC